MYGGDTRAPPHHRRRTAAVVIVVVVFVLVEGGTSVVPNDFATRSYRGDGVARVRDDGDPAADSGDARHVDRDGVKYAHGLEAPMGSSRGDGSVAIAATTTTTTKTALTAADTRAVDRGRLRLLDGFFRRERNATGSRVNYRARADGTAAADETTTGRVTVDPAGAAYATEPECESANGRRPCVCLVPDFLDDLLDETKAGGGGGDDRWTAKCPSYQAVPKAFFVSPAAKEAAEVRTARGPETESPGAGWIPVDFDRVARYRLDKSDDGACVYNKYSCACAFT